MLPTYYTLRALARAWSPVLVGCHLAQTFSQVRDEVTLAFAHPDREPMLRVSTRPSFLYAFRTDGFSKARRNVATLFEDAAGPTVTSVRIAPRDRMLFVDLDDGRALQLVLFGSRANVLLVDAEGQVEEAFKDDEALAGSPAPTPRPAPLVDAPDALAERWRTNRKTAAHALAAAQPLFDRTLATEAFYRAGLDADAAPDSLTDADLAALFAATEALETAFEAPAPRIYWRDRFADTFALVPLQHLEADDALRAEPFETVDEAVRVFVRRTLAQTHFRALYEPLEKALVKAHDDNRRRAERVLDELANESRADRYEHWGHLLMATPGAVPPGADAVTLPDLFDETRPEVTIPLDPALSAVANAERLYDKARRTRRAREEAENRLVDFEAQAEGAQVLLDEVRGLDFLSDLQAFLKERADDLAPFVGEEAAGQDRVPFRRYDLGGGYEVWVGRNARQNDDLTFHHAQKYDLWMHARGVPGSHAVLRLPGRNAQPGTPLLMRAAAVAAYYSKARGSSLVPVMVAPRKYVRKPKGAAPGAVVVEREDVLLVEPGLPG